MTDRRDDRVWSWEEILFSLRCAGADRYIQKLELTLDRLEELMEKGSPQPETSEVVLMLHEDAGVLCGYSYPLYIIKYGREVRYSRLVFQMELAQIARGGRLEKDDEKWGEVVLELARLRQVTPETACRWYIEELRETADDHRGGSVSPCAGDLLAGMKDLHVLERLVRHGVLPGPSAHRGEQSFED